ncbi:MAG TPA: hypothetical protein P5571_14935 [Candidatus Krumholzibacteria bacterium]|nr:hypothetical protein [Candidatus Krumholzibacteria bacterium]
MNPRIIAAALLLAATALAGIAGAYPNDGYAGTGIRRLERLRLQLEADPEHADLPAGGRLGTADIVLHLADSRGDSVSFFPAPDRRLQAALEGIFPDRDESYSVALMDITPGRPFRYAAIQPERQFSPGSVGKIAIAAGLFAELRRLFPDDVDARARLLRERVVTATDWIVHDEHAVPIYEPGTGAFVSRRVREGDAATLYEWTDHMLSASANAAASLVWKEVMLMRAFGASYPPSPEEEAAFFSGTPKTELRDLAVSVVNEPLRAAGIPETRWRLGSFFTRRGKAIVPGSPSLGTPAGALSFLLQIERGAVVDAWSSLEIKRLLYMTARRIRYASSPALASSAVYFKSGSLYRCEPEPEFTCRKYMGNVENTMNSIAIVERPDGTVYCVALMSNILRRNSAVEHQTLATFIDRIMGRP